MVIVIMLLLLRGVVIVSEHRFLLLSEKLGNKSLGYMDEGVSIIGV